MKRGRPPDSDGTLGMLRLDQLRSLPYRLTLTYVVIFGLFQVLLWMVVDYEITGYLRSRFDDELLRRAHAVVETYEMMSQRKPKMSTADQFREVLEAFRSDQMYLLIHLHADNSEIVSKNMLGVRFPYETTLPGEVGAPRFSTMDGDVAQTLCGDGSLRLLTVDCESQGPKFYVQIAMCTGSLMRVETSVERLLFVFVLISILIAGISSWIVVRRSLAPISVIGRELGDWSAARLDKRITVPTTRDEISDMVLKLNLMLERLEGQFSNCTRFISHVAHELKTPLAVLLGQIQQQQKVADQGAELSEFLHSAEEEIWRLLRTLESFLILTRAQDAKKLEVVSDVSIEDVVLTAIQDCTAAAKARNVQIVLKIDSEESQTEPIVSGDADLLISMVENLINNAVRHSPSGHIVDVKTRSTLREMEIKVRDYGPGIAEEHHERIFEFLYQVSPGSPQGGKAGIGLAIVKAVVDLHGGTVKLRNCEDGGCEFLVWLPLTRQRS